MSKTIIGRAAEQEILARLLANKQSDLLAIYGRRRVGKTFLITQCYAKNLRFYCSGQLEGNLQVQLYNFKAQLEAYFPNETLDIPGNWQEAFSLLRTCINGLRGADKKVLFFDELPWLDTHRSGFLAAFGYFWNVYASQRTDLLVVICGSAASWMIRKVVNNKGGLHNRITQRIRLMPFSLQETEAYLKAKNIHFNRYQLLQLYMVIGGIPHYLNAVQRGLSVPQIIDRSCFHKEGVLYHEFSNLYHALFKNATIHLTLIRALASRPMGLTRTQILDASGLDTGGGVTTALEELEESGFIAKALPFGKKLKDTLFRLADEYSYFYLRFIEGKLSTERGQWMALSQSPAYRAWCGYAFENCCLRHIGQIKRALGIPGVATTQSSWHLAGNGTKDGAQVDLLIDRADQTINLCEMKFSEQPFVINKPYAAILQRKILAFKQNTQTKKNTQLILITTYGVDDNAYRQQLVDGEVTMDNLFGE
ncbi:AAA family ATPase [Parapedobacter tibetensis]|uniref:AAA family ATPase n=1 Tax=Parapedobacter tibetensis TaxID=2972951 RepID=UPI00214DC30C|nr:ATP-binding protein [Parapedobacter tibetensis]